jgi:hypothetical protein
VARARVKEFRVVELRVLGGDRAEKKNYSRKGAKAQRKAQIKMQRKAQRETHPFYASFFAPLRLCGSDLHLMSLRFSGGRSAI